MHFNISGRCTAYTASTHSTSSFCTADTSELAVFRGSFRSAVDTPCTSKYSGVPCWGYSQYQNTLDMPSEIGE